MGKRKRIVYLAEKYLSTGRKMKKLENILKSVLNKADEGCRKILVEKDFIVATDKRFLLIDRQNEILKEYHDKEKPFIIDFAGHSKDFFNWQNVTFEKDKEDIEFHALNFCLIIDALKKANSVYLTTNKYFYISGIQIDDVVFWGQPQPKLHLGFSRIANYHFKIPFNAAKFLTEIMHYHKSYYLLVKIRETEEELKTKKFAIFKFEGSYFNFYTFVEKIEMEKMLNILQG